MPKAGMRWRHVVISTVNSWLPGDPRGFRSRKHKIHSSGDYKHRPPPGEHAGLHAYHQRNSGRPVIISPELRPVVGRAILAKLKKLEHQVLAVSVAGMHTHFLAELPDDVALIRHVLGQCKSASSHAIRGRLPGRVWGAGGDYDPVDDPVHHRNVYQYILDQENAWIWSFRDEESRRLEDSPSGLRDSDKPQGESASPGDRGST